MGRFTTLSRITQPGTYAIRCSVVHVMELLTSEEGGEVLQVRVSDGSDECLVSIRDDCLVRFPGIQLMRELVGSGEVGITIRRRNWL